MYSSLRYFIAYESALKHSCIAGYWMLVAIPADMLLHLSRCKTIKSAHPLVTALTIARH